MKTFTFTPRGVCSRRIEITLEGETVKQVKFMGGCSGNTQGVAALME
ncbi:MAG: TSCPD domain-containing protein, partial [Clostridia bacterium]|nr:TSCPD domain-containing protein [Clostridia bacterium]